MNKLIIVPRLLLQADAAHFQRSVRVEIAVAVILLLLTAYLSTAWVRPCIELPCVAVTPPPNERARLMFSVERLAAPQLFGKEQDIGRPRQFKQRVGVVTNRNRIKVTRTAVLLFSFPWESDILAPDFLIFFDRCPSETPLCTKKSAPSADLNIRRLVLNRRFYRAV